MYERTYKTIEDVYGKIMEQGCKAYLIGGISAAIQTNIDLYRQNNDLDIMVNSSDLPKVIEVLEEHGYMVQDKRGVKTDNKVDRDGIFHPMDHEVNAISMSKDVLGVGIFLYSNENGRVTLNSYAFDERIGKVVGSRTEIPEELFKLMYSDDEVNYHGTSVRSASKEYTYITKSNGAREKDKVDASILAPFIGEKEQERIKRISILQKRIKRYEDIYRDDGQIESTNKQPELEDTVYKFISRYSSNLAGMTQKQILDKLLLEPNMKTLMDEREDVRFILEELTRWENIDNLANAAKDVAHIYCYSDERDLDLKQYRRYGIREELLEGVYTEEEISNNISNSQDDLLNKDKKKDENDIEK